MQITRLVVKFIALISLFASCQITAMQPNRQQAPQVQLTDAEIDQITQEADEIVRNGIIDDAQMNQLNNEIQTLLGELGRQDPRPLGEFQNQVLFEIPLGPGRLIVEEEHQVYGPDRWEEGHWEEARVIPAHQVAAHWEDNIQGEYVEQRRYVPDHEENGEFVPGHWIEPGYYYQNNGGHWVGAHWEEERVEPRHWVEGRWVQGVLQDVPRTEKIKQSVVRVTGHHLLQIIFMTARCGLDFLFFKQLKKYYFQSVLSSWNDKLQQTLDVLMSIEQDEEGEFLWGDSSQRLIEDTFIATFTPDDTTNAKIWMLLGLYALASECHHAMEHKTLSMPWSGLIDFATRQGRKIERNLRDRKTNYPIPALILYMIDSWFLGGGSAIADSLPVVRNFALRAAHWNHDVLESYWFELAKHSVVLARFLRQTKSYFQSKTKTYVHDNKDKLCALISCLSKAKVANNIELQKEVEERLRQFIMHAYDYPFFEWVRFKGSCIFWTTIWIEMLLMSPALIEGGKIVYGLLRP